MEPAFKNQGKSQFIKDVLTKNSQANSQAVNDAWTQAGHEGTISTALVHKVRSDLGLTGRTGADRKPTRNNGAAKQRVSRPKGRPRTLTNGTRTVAARTPRFGVGLLEELEGEIDRLIFKIMGQGGLSEVEEVLRQARRLLVRSHEG